jgi:RNA polymerase sigma factor (sigma-70 family)
MNRAQFRTRALAVALHLDRTRRFRRPPQSMDSAAGEMNDASRPVLVGEDGKPLDHKIQVALHRMMRRIVRQFPALQDEVALVEVMEEAGRRIASREGRSGPLEKLHGYAWVTVRSVATSFMRRSATRLLQKTIDPDASEALLTSAPAVKNTPQDIEQQILLREVLNKLSDDERRICIWKKAGFSSEEIASHLGRSVAGVDTIFSRAKAKLRRLLTRVPGDHSELR